MPNVERSRDASGTRLNGGWQGGGAPSARLAAVTTSAGCLMYLAPPFLVWCSMDDSLAPGLSRFIGDYLTLAAIGAAGLLHAISLTALVRRGRSPHAFKHVHWLVTALVLGALALVCYAWMLIRGLSVG